MRRSSKNKLKPKYARRNVVNELITLENTLKRKLLTFYNQKIKPHAEDTTIETLKSQYSTAILLLIRRTIQESYLKGSELVGKQIKIKDFDIFITVKDAQNIEVITREMNDAFWRTADRLNRREIDYKLTKDQELVKMAPFDRNAAMVATASLVVFSTFNKAVLSKAEELPLDRIPQVPQVQFTSKGDSEVDPKICQPLDGTIWDVGDPSIVTPIIDTHPHCRCLLIPVEQSIV